MLCVNSLKLLFIVLLTFTWFNFSNNASLSIYEQKKYKRNAETQGLYSDKDDVEILTAENFNLKIFNNQRAWLMEFYNSWCGFCQRFAPSWKALATDVKGWRDVVGVGAIDCANEENYPICRDFEVMSYPTIRYFHENYKEGPKNFGQKISAGSDLVEHRQKLLEVIINEQLEGRGRIYPNLLPYTYSDTTKLFHSASEDTKYVFLVIQEPNNFLAQEVAMDLHKIKAFILRYALNNNTELIKSLNVNTFPSLYVIDKENVVQSIGNVPATRESYKTAIHNYLLPKHINVPLDTNNKTLFTGKWLEVPIPEVAAVIQDREKDALMDKVKKMGDVVFQMDLETALRRALRREVARVKEITGEKLDALRAFVNVLAKYFPFGKYGHLFLAELNEHIFSAETIKGADIYKMVKDAEKEERQVFSSPQQWLGCRGSSPTFRGYPCGLWKLFHYLTINAAEYNVGPKGSNPKIVLDAMRGYIKNFFGCTDCSNHFLEMAQRRELDKVTSWDESILWLWSAHNEVNKRLAKDPTEDPEYPKVQFPIKERCPQCLNSDDSWNTPEVLRYLKQVYSSIHVRYIGSDTRILHLGLEGSPSANSSSIFKTIDTNGQTNKQNILMSNENNTSRTL